MQQYKLAWNGGEELHILKTVGYVPQGEMLHCIPIFRLVFENTNDAPVKLLYGHFSGWKLVAEVHKMR